MSLKNSYLDVKGKKADENYASKYPLSNDMNTLQNYLTSAKAELAMLKAQMPTLSGDKRQRQRNITALSNRIMQLQNKTKDFNIGITGDSSSISIAPPDYAIDPKIDSTATPLIGVDDDPTQFETWKQSQNDQANPNVTSNPPFISAADQPSSISTIINDTIKSSVLNGSKKSKNQGPILQLKKNTNTQQDNNQPQDTTSYNKNNTQPIIKKQNNIGAYLMIGGIVLGVGVISYLMFKKKK